MSRQILKVQGAQEKTRWTLSQSDRSRESVGSGIRDSRLQLDKPDYDFNHTTMPSYESYNGSGYGSPSSSRTHSLQWKPPPNANNHFTDFNFTNSIEDTVDFEFGQGV